MKDDIPIWWRKEIKRLNSIGIPQQWAKGFDPEMVDVIIALNRAGFNTIQSCAGHRLERGSSLLKIPLTRGFIVFSGIPKTKKVISDIITIIKKHNLRNLRYGYHRTPDSKNLWFWVSFNAIGNPRGKRVI